MKVVSRLADRMNDLLTRTTSPQHGLLVLNRNGMNNFVRHLTPGTELDIQGQIVHVSGGDEKHDGEIMVPVDRSHQHVVTI